MQSAELSIILPTYKERGNVAELVRRLDAALTGIAWEAIFVDDNSPDGTAAAAKDIAAGDSRVRCLRRVGRRGLAGACIEGMLSSASPFVAVMDADLQHDEKVLPQMLAKLRDGGADLVAGGDIIVIGNLRGTAHASAYDDEALDHVIIALQMQPMQLRMGSVISRGSDEVVNGAEIARIENRRIIVEAFNTRILHGKRYR